MSQNIKTLLPNTKYYNFSRKFWQVMALSWTFLGAEISLEAAPWPSLKLPLVMTSYIQSQDGGSGGSILLPVLYLMMSLSSEGQNLSANQLSSTYLNHGWDITTSVWKTVRHIEIFLPFALRFWPDHSNLRALLHHITKFRPNDIGPSAAK